MSDPYELDGKAIRRAFSRAAGSFDRAGALQTEVRLRLLERLKLLRSQPSAILDLGSGTAHAAKALKAQFSGAHVLAVDLALPMLIEARHQQTWFKKFDRVAAHAFALPLRSGSIDWCVSNLMLAFTEPLDLALSEVRRILKPGGVFAFTSFGPDTLRELRMAWASLDAAPRVHRFIDMHDLGDALVRNGFAEPVLDVEKIVLTFDSFERLVRELKETGLTTALRGRPKHLGQRQMLHDLVNAYEPHRVSGKLPATFEIVFGQAWRMEDRNTKTERGEISFPVSRIGHRRV